MDAPPELVAKAEWVLGTLSAAACVPVKVVLAGDETGREDLALAYAPQPVPGVPTIPRSAEAERLLAERAPLPPQSFRRFVTSSEAGRALVGAFPAAAEGFAAPFDLVMSAFVLLACWDEHTSAERDRHGRFPYEASLFATNDALSLGEPACDGYAAELRRLVGFPSQEAPAFLVALTHDIDGLQRWTLRGWIAWSRRVAVAVVDRDAGRARWEAGSAAYHLRHDLPRGRDAAFTFPGLLSGEDRLGVSSSFYVIASHGHRTDGNQPANYRHQLPRALRLITAAGREVGLHGNHRDGRDLDALCDDRAGLERHLASLLSSGATSEGAAAEPGGRSAATVTGNRFHYLKYLYHESLPLLEAAGFLYDTSLAFAEREGARCGLSHPFHPWHMAEDRPLRLLELPLAVMDSTLQEAHYRHLPAEEARDATIAVLESVRRSGGCAAILWHHNRFHPYMGRGFDKVYWDVVRWVQGHGGACLGAEAALERWQGTHPPLPQRTEAEPEAQVDSTQTNAAAAARTTGAACTTRTERRPRIAHVSVVHRPDDPRIFVRECRSLADAGFDVTYLAPGADSGFVDGVHLSGLPRRPRSTRFLSAAPIMQTLHALQPDLIHVHDPELLTMFAPLRPYTPVLVYDMHEYLRDSIGAKYYIPSGARPAAAKLTAAAQRSLVAIGDGVVGVVEEQFEDLGARPRVRTVLPNYPRFARFRDAVPRAEMTAEPRLKMAYVGSLTRNRGVQIMLDSLREVPEAVLYLGGVFSNPEVEAEAHQVAETELAGRVHFLGFRSDIHAVMQAADIVCVPSTCAEGFGLAAAEAMCLGKPVIVSDRGALPEVADHGRAALIVDPDSPKDLAGAINVLIDQPDYAARLGISARMSAARRFSYTRWAREVAAVLAGHEAETPDRAEELSTEAVR